MPFLAGVLGASRLAGDLRKVSIFDDQLQEHGGVRDEEAIDDCQGKDATTVQPLMG